MSEPIDSGVTAQKPPCNRCGSHNIDCKGKRNGERRFRCRDCRKWFNEAPPNELDYDDILDAVDVYCFDVTALDRVNSHTTIASMKEQGKDLPDSRTNWSRFFIEEGECLENGPEITRTRQGSMSGILVIDSMHRRIEGKMHYIWIAIDGLPGEIVHYDVTTDKTLATVTKFLFELRLKGDYEAVIVVSDQEAAILSAVRLVFPNAKLQGCVVHRMRRLYRKLRTTQRKGRPIRPERLKIRAEFTELARRLIHSLTSEEKQDLTDQIQSRELEWAGDPQTLIEYENLMANLQYYLTAQELGEAPNNTNQCESANDLFSKFVSRRQGFKNLRAARAYLKAFFAVYRLRRNGTIGHKESPYLLPAIPTAASEPCQPLAALSPEASPESIALLQISETNTMTTSTAEATIDPSESILYDSAHEAVSFAHEQPGGSEPILQNNMEPDGTQNEVTSNLTQTELQKFRELESGMKSMLAGDSYILTSPKAFVNRFEILARKLHSSPLCIAINKIDGSVIRIAPIKGKKESIRSCRTRSKDPDRVSPIELQCLHERFDQIVNSLEGPYYEYACVKSFANSYYRILDKRGRNQGSNSISKEDGSLTSIK